MRHVLHLVASIAFVVVACVGCTAGGGAPVSAGEPKRPDRGSVVASIEQSKPGDALRQYLHGWMTEYNTKSGVGDASSAVASWTPEVPQDTVSVMPAVPLTDLGTVSAWSATIVPRGAVTESHASYRADFTFWRGNPASSAKPATPMSATATYDLTWNPTRGAWAITQTSDSPDMSLAESSGDASSGP